MPMAMPMCGPDLEIQLQPGNQHLCPGSTVRGRVIRRTAPTVSPQATVVVRLLGREKVKFSISHGQTVSVYRNRLLLLSEEVELYTGPIHIQPDDLARSWQFAIRIPYNADPRTVIGGLSGKQIMERIGISCFKSLSPSTIRSQPLLGSFVGDGSYWQNGSGLAFVEYTLQASFVQEGQRLHVSKALIPIQLRPFVPELLTSFELVRHSQEDSLTSFRLVPGKGPRDTHMSFKERIYQSVNAGRVPQLSVSLYVDIPAMVQLGNWQPIPFRVRLVAERRHTSERLRDVPYKGYIKMFELILEAHTSVIGWGEYGNGKALSNGKQKHTVFRAAKVAKPYLIAARMVSSLARTSSGSREAEDETNESTGKGKATHTASCVTKDLSKSPSPFRSSASFHSKTGRHSMPLVEVFQPSVVDKEKMSPGAAQENNGPSSCGEKQLMTPVKRQSCPSAVEDNQLSDREEPDDLAMLAEPIVPPTTTKQKATLDNAADDPATRPDSISSTLSKESQSETSSLEDTEYHEKNAGLRSLKSEVDCETPEFLDRGLPQLQVS